MLGELATVIAEHENINRTLKRSLTRGADWFCASLPPILRALADLRNPAAHSSSLDRETVHRRRNQYLGVGCEGDLVKLAKVQVS